LVLGLVVGLFALAGLVVFLVLLFRRKRSEFEEEEDEEKTIELSVDSVEVGFEVQYGEDYDNPLSAAGFSEVSDDAFERGSDELPF
jgi:hypothetical protein